MATVRCEFFSRDVPRFKITSIVLCTQSEHESNKATIVNYENNSFYCNRYCINNSSDDILQKSRTAENDY